MYHLGLQLRIATASLGRVATADKRQEGLRQPSAIITYPDIFLILFYNGIVLAVLYGVTATTSVLFQTSYPSSAKPIIGLCYLAIAANGDGSLLSGRLLDRDYQIIKNETIRQVEADGEKGMRLRMSRKKRTFQSNAPDSEQTPNLPCRIGYYYDWIWLVPTEKCKSGVPLILQVISESRSVPLMCNIDATPAREYPSWLSIYRNNEYYTDLLST